MKRRILALVLSIAMCVGMLAGCGSNGGGGKKDAFVIMTEQLDGLFNPFFYTAAPDGTIVSMTQISMLGAKYEGGEVKVAYGEDEAVVTKDYDITENADGTVTYRFVLKNGIKFSDGHPLTMEDVLFNYYVYLDPVYTGSNTLYSTDILGLAEYRTQTVGSSAEDGDNMITSEANNRASNRIMELISLFQAEVKASSTKEVGYDAMKSAISGQVNTTYDHIEMTDSLRTELGTAFDEAISQTKIKAVWEQYTSEEIHLDTGWPLSFYQDKYVLVETGDDRQEKIESYYMEIILPE